MSNLIEETTLEIQNSNHTELDVSWVGSLDGKYAMSWNQFKNLFKEINYNPGYGGQEIASDLTIVFFDDSWLERGEYDGSEWWSYKKYPTMSQSPNTFSKIYCCEYWESLANLNNQVDNA